MTRRDGTGDGYVRVDDEIAERGDVLPTEAGTVQAPIGLADLLAELGQWAARVEAVGGVLEARQAACEREPSRAGTTTS